MARYKLAGQEGFTPQGVPLVLALTSYESVTLRERLLMALASSCARQGGRVLVIEQGPVAASQCERGALHRVADVEGFPGEVVCGNEGIHYATLNRMSQADIYLALDNITGNPPRFDLVLLQVRSDAPQEMFLASLAQRVVVVTTPGEAAQQAVRSRLERLADRHQQRHFTLAVDGSPEQARHFYRHLLEHSVSLTQVECDLLEELPDELRSAEESLADLLDRPELLALFAALWQDFQPLAPRGGLQLFWHYLLFCNDCSLKMCRKLLATGQPVAICPVQKF